MSTPAPTVGSICHSPVLTCGPDTPVAEAARIIHSARCSSIVIEEDGRYIGIWTERDALKAELSNAAALRRPIRGVMSSPLRTIPASMTLAEATVRFLEGGIRHYLVTDDSGQEMVGIISQTDVVLNQGIEYYLRLREVRSILGRRHTPVPAAMPLSEVSGHMRTNQLDAVAVVYPDGTLGILSERDMVRLVAEMADDHAVGDVASRPLLSVKVSESLYAARALLGEHNIRHLGVVEDDGHLVSLLSFSDILTSIEHSYLHELQATLKDREEALALSRGKLRMAGKLFQTTLEAIVITDGNGLIQSTNPACNQLTGFAEADLVGRPLSTIISGRHGQGFQQEIWATLGEQGQWRGELWSRRRSGEAILNLVTITGIDEENGRPSSYAVVFADIVSDVESAARLRYLSIHDALTGLPNRTGLAESLEQAFAQYRGDGMVLLVAGTDRINLVNEALGFSAGDEVLVNVAERIVAAVGTATVARLGSDEFAVLATPLPHPDGAAQLADRILAAVSLPMIVTGEEIAISVSIGVAAYPADGATPDLLLNSAHAAMTAAKQAGRNRVQFATPEAECRTRRQLSVEAALRRAIGRNELEVYYQPKISFADMSVTGMEALARWHHPTLGDIPPSQFIPIAEEAGLIDAIGQWVLETACAQSKLWMDNLAPLKVAVNLSGHQVRLASLKGRVASILGRTGLPAELLELEVTETVAMSDVDANLRHLQALADLGICLSIDDFGTGYSSFSYLRRFPINKLKIDRSFIVAMDEDDRAAAIPEAIINMAHTLGLTVVGEGVETRSQMDVLASARCDEGQGYYFSRPLPANMFESFCRKALLIGFAPAPLQWCAE